MDGNTSIEQVPTCKQFWKNHTLTLEGHKEKQKVLRNFITQFPCAITSQPACMFHISNKKYRKIFQRSSHT